MFNIFLAVIVIVFLLRFGLGVLAFIFHLFGIVIVIAIVIYLLIEFIRR